VFESQISSCFQGKRLRKKAVIFEKNHEKSRYNKNSSWQQIKTCSTMKQQFIYFCIPSLYPDPNREKIRLQ